MILIEECTVKSAVQCAVSECVLICMYFASGVLCSFIGVCVCVFSRLCRGSAVGSSPSHVTRIDELLISMPWKQRSPTFSGLCNRTHDMLIHNVLTTLYLVPVFGAHNRAAAFVTNILLSVGQNQLLSRM